LGQNVRRGAALAVSDADSSEVFRLRLLNVTDCENRNCRCRTGGCWNVARDDHDPRLRSDAGGAHRAFTVLGTMNEARIVADTRAMQATEAMMPIAMRLDRTIGFIVFFLSATIPNHRL
jgi:hypothetical protein